MDLQTIQNAIETEKKFRATPAILIQGGEYTKRKHREKLDTYFDAFCKMAEDKADSFDAFGGDEFAATFKAFSEINIPNRNF
tara:strand:+ start:338 stop:583 length:246 start_codon:yes stop_codon:yes gene_type:complete